MSALRTATLELPFPLSILLRPRTVGGRPNDLDYEIRNSTSPSLGMCHYTVFGAGALWSFGSPSWHGTQPPMPRAVGNCHAHNLPQRVNHYSSRWI
ncbi:hypothetical protein H4582DRAFT_1942261 [Lactarius indigo]|nr:hypothetical protein H4582DRAFT_1942261 [Lactarius indigo]